MVLKARGGYLGVLPHAESRASHRCSSDDVVKVAPLLGMVEGWSAFLAGETATEHVELLRLHERTGRPLGSDEFIGPSGEDDWPKAEEKKAWAKENNRRQLSMVYPELR